VLAVDAQTGRVFWQYRYTNSPDARVCCGANNRGLAILGSTLFMGTLDGHLVAIDAAGGRPLWNVALGDPALGYSITMAPLAVKDKILVGVGGGEYGIRGFVAAFDPATGKELWRFYTIPGPGERGHETWSGDTWKTGGGSVWMTPSYDPALNLTYWGIGNPGPDWNAALRPGDNLFTDSVIALDADTGTLKWHFQFTPNDTYDYDSVQVAVLADISFRGAPTKTLMWANRNGFFYVLNRETGAFLSGAPFVKVNWASGLDAKGRPITTPQPAGSPTWPGNQGGTNWYSPSFSPRTGLFYISAWEGYASIFRSEPATYIPGRNFAGGGHTVVTPVPGAPGVRIGRYSPINDWTDVVGHGAVIALDPADDAAQVDVPAVRRHRQRHPDHRHRPAVHRGTRGLLLRARRAQRRRAVESQPRRPDRQRPDDLRARRQAVRGRDLRKLALCLWPSRLSRLQCSSRVR
jgi:alcohol dehydrogenase (cytochrome c)